MGGMNYCHACPHAAKNAPITLADCTLDPGSHQLTYRGDTIRLSPMRAQLLALLMRAHGRTVSQGLIDEHLWPEGELPDGHIVKVHVCRLRRVLSRTPLQIKTVHRVGIRLVVDSPALVAAMAESA